MLGLGSGINRLSAAEAAAIAGRIPGFTGLLDESYGASAEAAYSVRKLTNRVSVAMTIRRDSDSTETDIGFDANGNIDEAAITAFCTGTTCMVASWKDQSGNDNHAVQAVARSQPTIYTGGAIVKDNGKAMITGTGTEQAFNIPISSTDAYKIFSVMQSHAPHVFLGSENANDYFLVAVNGNSGSGSGAGFTLTSSRLDGNSYTIGTRNDVYDDLVTRRLFYADIDLNFTGTTLQNSYGGNATYRMYNSQELIFYPASSTNPIASIESNVGGYFTQNTPLLDTYTGAAAAYSLRKLSSSYSGPAIRVRRDNDNLETDINFNVFGELDTVSLTAHCGSNNGYVTNWYDQSSNSNTARQTTAASQPKIYDSTTGVVTENGKPAVDFDGSDFFSFNSRIYTARTMVAVLNMTAFTYNRLCSNSVEIQNSGKGWVNGGGSRDTNEKFNINAVSINGVVDSTSPYGSNLIGLYNLSYFTGSGVDSNGLGEIGWHDPNRSLLGRLQELILYSNEDTANRTNIESNINTFYSIY